MKIVYYKDIYTHFKDCDEIVIKNYLVDMINFYSVIMFKGFPANFRYLVYKNSKTPITFQKVKRNGNIDIRLFNFKAKENDSSVRRIMREKQQKKFNKFLDDEINYLERDAIDFLKENLQKKNYLRESIYVKV